MPTYTFVCKNPMCPDIGIVDFYEFEIFSSMQDYKDTQKCPSCGHETSIRDLQADVPALKTETSCTTVGQMAERNSAKMNEKQMAAHHTKMNEYRKAPPTIKPISKEEAANRKKG